MEIYLSVDFAKHINVHIHRVFVLKHPKLPQKLPDTAKLKLIQQPNGSAPVPSPSPLKKPSNSSEYYYLYCTLKLEGSVFEK